MQTRFKNYYKILQVDHEAEPEVIDAAYRRLARKYHPDVNGAVGMTQQMQELNEAYKILRDATRRREYDRAWLAFLYPQPPPPPVTRPAPRPARQRPAAREAEGARPSERPRAYQGYRGVPRASSEEREGPDWLIIGIVAATTLLVCPPFFYFMVTTVMAR